MTFWCCNYNTVEVTLWQQQPNEISFRQGRYRIIYSIQDEEVTVWVVKIGHSREIYR